MRLKNQEIRAVRTVLFAGAAAVALSGCVGGTTYGTGVTQEAQTLKDMYSMFTLKTDRKNIDYSPRPDLIVPDNKLALAEPIDESATATSAEWPETPEERIARIRAQAGEVDPRTGEYGIEERLRKKEGIAIETADPTPKFVPGRTDRDGNPLGNVAGSQAAREEVLKRKAELSLSPGASRKFLTEPPVEYRVPVGSAPAGEEAYSEEEKAAKAEAERKARLKKMQEMGGRG